MIALNENPVITREKIRVARLASLEIPHKDTGDHLDNQVELVKVSLHPLSSEEMTKLWSSFFQTHYRLSVAYAITVVLLDSKKEIAPGLPVQERKLYVFPFREPVIDKIEPQIVERTDDAQINLIGRNLLSNKVKILFGTEYSIIPKPADTSDTQIIIELPKELTAGVKQVQVIHPMMAGDPPIEHGNWTVSNIAAFVLSSTYCSQIANYFNSAWKESHIDS